MWPVLGQGTRGHTFPDLHPCLLQSTPSPSADLLGLRAAPPPAAAPAPAGTGNLLVDVFSDGPAAQPSLGPTPEEAFLRYQAWPPGSTPPWPLPPHLSQSALFSFLLSPFLSVPLSGPSLPLWDWLPATPVFSVCSGIGWPSELEPPAPESPMALLADPAPVAE